MSRRILVLYSSRHGSTTQVAEAIAAELGATGASVDCSRLAPDTKVRDADAVVLGGPMIMGWHAEAQRFLRAHRDALAQMPTAIFLTAMSLTATGQETVKGVPLFLDPWLPKEPRRPEKLSYRERYARPDHYVGDVLDSAPKVRPVSVAVFGGKLDLTEMSLLEKLFVLLAIRATPGDARNYEAARAWARQLAPLLER